MTITIDELKLSLLYSEELGIALRENKERESFKWFLASLLFGGRISETIAKNTYRTFERYSLLRPRKIPDAGWVFSLTRSCAKAATCATMGENRPGYCLTVECCSINITAV